MKTYIQAFIALIGFIVLCIALIKLRGSWEGGIVGAIGGFLCGYFSIGAYESYLEEK